MSIQPLTPEQLEQELGHLDHWTVVEGKLQRQLTFKDFVEAFAFMTQVAELAESHQHHPEWFNVYNRVRIDLTTHDAGGISVRDIDFAKAIDALQGA